MVRHWIGGFVAGFLLIGCVSASIGYKYYGLDADSYGGKLLGPKPKDDIPFEVCKPDEQSKGKCAVMLSAEFKSMATELVTLRQRVKELEKQLQSCGN